MAADGKWYTKQEFRAHFDGYAEWDAAAPRSGAADLRHERPVERRGPPGPEVVQWHLAIPKERLGELSGQKADQFKARCGLRRLIIPEPQAPEGEPVLIEGTAEACNKAHLDVQRMLRMEIRGSRVLHAKRGQAAPAVWIYELAMDFKTRSGLMNQIKDIERTCGLMTLWMNINQGSIQGPVLVKGVQGACEATLRELSDRLGPEAFRLINKRLKHGEEQRVREQQMLEQGPQHADDEERQIHVNISPGFWPRLIGSKGTTRKEMEHTCNVYLEVPQQEERDTAKVGLQGKWGSIMEALAYIQRHLGIPVDAITSDEPVLGLADQARPITHSDSVVDLEVQLPRSKWGLLVGRNGVTVNKMEELCAVRIRLPWSRKRGEGAEGAFHITGSPEGCREAVRMIGVVCRQQPRVLREIDRDTVDAEEAAEKEAEVAEELACFPMWRDSDPTRRAPSWGAAVVKAILPNLDDEASYADKVRVCRELQALLHKAGYPKATVFLFGSSVTGLAEKTADLDISCDLHGTREWPPPGEENVVVEVTEKFKLLEKGWETLEAVPRARVPIINNVPSQRGAVVGLTSAAFDLSFRLHGVINSHLLRAYAAQRPAVRLAAVAVKAWSKEERINNSRQGYLTSYAVVIMLFYYLLRREKVQWIDPKEVTLDSCDPLPPVVECTQPTERITAEVGMILADFWHFYAEEFGWETHVITLNRPATQLLTKAELGWDRPSAVGAGGGGRRRRIYNVLCIEDPYEMREPGSDDPLNLGRHLTRSKAADVRLAFLRSWRGFATLPEDVAAEAFGDLLQETQQRAPNRGFIDACDTQTFDYSDAAHRAQGGSSGSSEVGPELVDDDDDDDDFPPGAAAAAAGVRPPAGSRVGQTGASC